MLIALPNCGTAIAPPQPEARSLHLRFDVIRHRVRGVFGVIEGVFTNSVITSIMAPRYFCSTVMLCAIERTSVPAAIEACRSFCDICWQGFQPAPDMSTSRRAGIDPFAWLKIVWKSGDRIRWASSFEPASSPGRSA